MWFLIFIAITIAIFFIFIEEDFKKLFISIKNRVQKGSQLIDDVVKSKRKNLLTRFLLETENRIQSSNLRLYIPYNTFIHIVLSLFMSIAVFSFVERYLNNLISIIFSAVGFMIPYILLQLITESMNAKVKKYSVDFLIILKNYFKATGDIFEAFKQGKESFMQPLQTYVGIAVYEYENKIRAVQVLDNLSEKLPTKELSSFIQNIKICYLYGGNIEGLIDEYINDVSGINDDSDKEDLEDKILNKGLYVLLAINFFFIYFMLNGEYREHLANTTWGTVVLSIDLVVSIYIIYNILKREV